MRFDRWNTAFCDMDVQILSLSYRTHRVTAGTQEPRSNELRSRSVEVISGEDRFRIDADAIRSASWMKRIAGIVGRADAQAPRPGRITFRVRNHGWTEESPLSFMHERVGGWSYVIATDGQCVEMLEDDYQQLPIGLVGRHGRCRYDPASKNRLVAACLEPFASVARLALEHRVNANLLCKWIKKRAEPASRPVLITGDYPSSV
ncbi:IS66 family insertion sequence hypothetical protein [Sinorhizobium meliloti]|nr:transposase [Sinorhizobium meliloti]RVG27254.1 IS66 family insertion sequence hypothetical protein [Sinorhizobium meliloti]RVK91254.1 IS66 family insertion sequence hypothetical protein [Sinorhizobium meliloti]RVN47225.1 IS66 family insertion sequence hypothetical protein [Sinorhizobium meliloti]RVO48516.1 IS66 family insertion sequence hypothetical protein [Sinorhizobium meliloti]